MAKEQDDSNVIVGNNGCLMSEDGHPSGYHNENAETILQTQAGVRAVYATCADESPTYAAIATEETNLYGTLSVLTDQHLHGTVLLRMTPNFDMNISVVWKYAFKHGSIASARTVTPNDTNFRLNENGALYLMLIKASIDYNETYFWVEQSDRRKVMSPFIQLILKDHTLFPLVLSTTIGISVVLLLFIGNLIFFIPAIKKTGMKNNTF
ncbi:hypothetical protein MAR_020568 [Mya arenaria]|uniref:Uncharacterized protein n=1 Tax=Mya arenaria TaxID=6604 RepID=A0ABY7E7R2_MYAAR|nr:hypothetical protein MAR_020568 [Mya arenaria]